MKKALNAETQAKITPQNALELLKEGNKRFTDKKYEDRDLLEQVRDTAGGQWPHSVVLSCIDSRVPAEIVFDQGVGDIFSARVAGNIIDENILGSIEYGCKVAGSKLVVVLGHTMCGAVKGACDGVELGNITALLANIKPAVAAVAVPKQAEERTSKNADFVNAVVDENVRQTIGNIRRESPLLTEMEKNGEIIIKGAVYDVSNGSVSFFD